MSGVLAAILSTALGGTAIVATRFLAGAADPITIAVLRFAGGAVLLLPLAPIKRERWPGQRDWPDGIGLALLFFGLFPVLFNAALIYTTAARGALALSTTPLITMLVAALLGIERLTLRKSVGLVLAMGGVAIALGASLSVSPLGAWRGDALMLAGAACMALYTVWSRPLIVRSGPIAFAVTGMIWASPCGVEGSVRNLSTPGGWNGTETSPEAEAELRGHIGRIFAAKRRGFCAARIPAELRREGRCHARRRIERLMRDIGLQA